MEPQNKAQGTSGRVPEHDGKSEGEPREPVSDGDAELDPKELDKLGWFHMDRFWRFGELNDLEKAVEYGSRALELTPDGHSDRPPRLGDLGAFYGERFKRLGELEDIKKAIEHSSRAIALTPDDHPDLSHWYDSLGVCYGHRFQRLGELDDLEKAIELFSRALALIPNGHPDLSYRHASLGAAYNDRFRRLGELDDLERSSEHFSRALALTPDGHPDLSHRHADLGLAHNDRFRRLRESDSLAKAIEHLSRALALTPNGHPDLSARNDGLGVAYSDRFQHLGKLDDLEKEIVHFSCALALTPEGHPNSSLRNANLGTAYNDRFRHLGGLDDLEKAIDYSSRALALTPNGHPHLSSRHANLGAAYNDRFHRLGEPNDLKMSIEHASHALTLTPDGHPDLSLRHFNRAMYYFNQYQETYNPSELQESLHSFRRASQVSTGVPRDKFQYALRWAKLADEHESFRCIEAFGFEHQSLQCIEAYQTAIDLLPHFIWLGTTTGQRYQDLSTVGNLAVNAASAAILDSEIKLALEWLEHARCVVWNQSLMLRSPLDHLEVSHPELAAHLQEVAKQLHDAGSESSTLQILPSGSVDPEQAARKRRRLAKEYDDMLAKARQYPGFEDFLQPMKAERLVRVAQSGPIVVINCYAGCCDALLLLPGKDNISHIALPDFNAHKAKSARSQIQTFLSRKGIRERGVRIWTGPGQHDSFRSVLAALWNGIVKPVLDFLGYSNNISLDDLPHITWCPTGELSFLPLHAAGDYDQPQSRVFDYVISSYTPTLTALLSCTPSSLNQDSGVLAIGQAATPGHKPLPGTTTELASVKGHTEAKAKYSQLIGDQATRKGVLDAMEQHDWVHLACHAHQNVETPTKSGFHLHDGTLDLSAINQRSFKNKGLAFPSACQTATGDEKLPDEAIHLASGMLMAGYPSVIATMWSVMDDDAPFVADKVYAELMKDGRVGNGEAGKALHHAVAALREKVGEKEFARWVPYIHIGS
ncbi:hypothetical protein FRC11_009017, partial [Ceratobasidium sp. 423]